MIIYAFDVDHTLEVSVGPVLLADLVALRAAGHCVGVCGNFAVLVARWSDWHKTLSFIGPMEMLKVTFLSQIKRYVRADEYVMVGNDGDGGQVSADKQAAEGAGWRFISEKDFAGGAR